MDHYQLAHPDKDRPIEHDSCLLDWCTGHPASLGKNLHLA